MSNIFQALMIIGPVLGYFDQIYKFRKTKSSKGFSLDTSGILLISSIIRIYFWFGKRFDNVLLYQSIFMIFTQLLVLHQAINYRIKTPSIFNPSQRKFWNWSTLTPYLKFLASLTATLCVLNYLFNDKHWFIELLGFLVH
ncbi:22633_t:CDS:2 [Entrophospora sp. SA101]|nr:22633_t:CDS:2 [Entrophospora sp. SA101]